MRQHLMGWIVFTFTVIGAPIVLLPLATQCGMLVLWGIDQLVSGREEASLAKKILDALPQLMGVPDGKWWIGTLYFYGDIVAIIVLVGGAFVASILAFTALVVASGGPMRLPPSPPWRL